MPLPSPPPPPSPTAGRSLRPAWYSLSRWLGSAPASMAANTPGRAPAGAEAEVERLRTQARRRLMGAVVLLAAGVIAFPLVFETEPRPMGVDTPMQRVQGTVGADIALARPPQGNARTEASEAGPAPPGTPGAAPAEPAAGPPAEAPAPAEVQTPAPAPVAAPVPAPAAAPPSPAPSPKTMPATATAAAAATPSDVPGATSAAGRAQADRAQALRAAAESAEAQRARALLEGRSAASPTAAARPAEPVVAARYVVQVGAFTEKRALAEARSRVERLGLKTYTQVIESPAGPRTRVRVGPFDSRAEADAAGAKLKAAGLPAAILTL